MNTVSLSSIDQRWMKSEQCLPGGIRSSVILDQAVGATVLQKTLYLAPSLETVLARPMRPSFAVIKRLIHKLSRYIVHMQFKNGRSIYTS